MKHPIYLLLSCVLISCNVSPDYKVANDPATPTISESKEQLRITAKRAEAMVAYGHASNQLQKNEMQTQFNKWVESYFKDTLKGKIIKFAATVNQIKSGNLSDFKYLYVEFKAEDKLILFREEDVKTDAILKKTQLYKSIINVSEGQNVYVNGKFVKIAEPHANEIDYSSINYPRIYISIDSIINFN